MVDGSGQLDRFVKRPVLTATATGLLAVAVAMIAVGGAVPSADWASPLGLATGAVALVLTGVELALNRRDRG